MYWTVVNDLYAPITSPKADPIDLRRRYTGSPSRRGTPCGYPLCSRGILPLGAHKGLPYSGSGCACGRLASGTHKGCPYGNVVAVVGNGIVWQVTVDHNDSVDMIRHHDELIHLDRREPLG